MKYKIYATKTFAEIVKMYGSNVEFAKRVGVDPAVLTRAIKGKPVQAGLVAQVVGCLNAKFESLFKVR